MHTTPDFEVPVSLGLDQDLDTDYEQRVEEGVWSTLAENVMEGQYGPMLPTCLMLGESGP